jgi:hypothetical protein
MNLTPEQLRERTVHRRAVEAAIWGKVGEFVGDGRVPGLFPTNEVSS